MGIDQTKDEAFTPYKVRRAAEDAYVVFVEEEVAASGGTLSLHLENPTNDLTLDVFEFIISAQFTGTFYIYDTFDGDVTGGTTETIHNMLMDSDNGTPDSGNMAAASNVTFTATDTHFGMALPGANAPGNAVAGPFNATTPLMKPGREIVIEITNTGENARRGGIAVVFSETRANVTV